MFSIIENKDSNPGEEQNIMDEFENLLGMLVQSNKHSLINTVFYSDGCLLELATANELVGFVKLLFEYGADPNIQHGNYFPLIGATMSGKVELLEIYLDCNDSNGRVDFSTRDNYFGVCKQLLKMLTYKFIQIKNC